MQKTITELQKIITLFSHKLNELSEEELSIKKKPDGWTKKEILGHLIDSAQNNLRRFICGQYDDKQHAIVYDQDFWVAANNYNYMSKDDIITLWKLMNERICAVLEKLPQENYTKECNTGKNTVELHNLQWLAEDYNKHLKHHLNQILPRSFNIIYP